MHRPEILADVASLGRAGAVSQANRRATDQLRHHFRCGYNDTARPRPEHASAPFGAALLRFHSSPTLVTRFTSWIGSRCWSVTARHADIRARVNAQIRDCNKTTDVRTTDSRTGIAPPSPLARALLSRTLPRSLSLYASPSRSRTSPISPTTLRSPFTSRRSNLSLLLFPLSTLFPSIPARGRNEPPHFFRKKKKMKASRRD